MPRSVDLACFSIALAVASHARADIDPPRGLEWLPRARVAIENLAEFSDWVLVAWPCHELPHRSPALDPYCVVRAAADGQPAFVDPAGALYALATRDTQVVFDPKGSADGKAAWVIIKPEIRDVESFFGSDRRVVRSAFVPNGPGVRSVPDGLGLQEGLFWIRIEAIDEKGIRARFSKVTWTCRSGDTIELPWDASEREPPLPVCPSVGLPQLPAELPAAPAPPERNRRSLWLGLAIAGVSLLAGGILLKREAKSGR